MSLGHHVFTPDYPSSSPLTILAAIAARTSRIRLATIIYLLPLYHPVTVADQVATLDLISGGRAIFGVGIGYRNYEFEGFGVDPRTRGARMDEALEAIRTAWTTGRFHHSGRLLTIPDLPAAPLPIQKPHPPIWVGGVSRPALKRAARLGDGWVSANMQPLDDLRTMAETYRGHCAEQGRQPFLCVSRDTWVSTTREEMMAEWYPDMLQRHVALKRMGLAGSDPTGVMARIEQGDQVAPEEFMDDRMVGGTPEEVVGQIRRWRSQTACQAMLMLMSKKLSFDRLCNEIELFGSKVLPQLAEDRGAMQ